MKRKYYWSVIPMKLLKNIKIKKLINNGRILRDHNKTCKDFNLKTNQTIFIVKE